MSKQPWKTKDWFVSPWNFEKEVTEQFKFPKEVKIHDITLRDGEQQTGLAFEPVFTVSKPECRWFLKKMSVPLRIL
jgi:hypothetical protein